MTTALAQPTLADLAAKLDALAAQVALLADSKRESELAGRQWNDLAADVVPVAGAVFGRVVAELEERRDYFTFAQAGLGVVDQVVTSFTEEDVEQLGDNIVLILHTVKEMTQPEVMRLLQRTARVVRADGDTATPSMLGLLREMRDPAVKRGLHRLLTILRSLVADEDGAHSEEHQPDERRP